MHVFGLVAVDRPITTSLKYRLLGCILHSFFPEDGSNSLLRNIGEIVPYYTALHPRWCYYTYYVHYCGSKNGDWENRLLWNMKTANQRKDNAKKKKQKEDFLHASECDHGPASSLYEQGIWGAKLSSAPRCAMSCLASF
jgi:hypothetical protein